MTHPNDDPTTDNDADHATSAFRADQQLAVPRATGSLNEKVYI